MKIDWKRFASLRAALMTGCLALAYMVSVSDLAASVGLGPALSRLVWTAAEPTETNGPGKPDAAKTAAVDFATEIAPLLTKHCLACHGPDRQQSGYRLDERQIAFRGGDLGEAAIVPNKSTDSPLIEYVSGTGSIVMPPKGPRLSAGEIALLQRWIDQGANWPEKYRFPKTPAGGGAGASNSAHWAYQPVQRPEPPAIAPPQGTASAVRNPIDQFIVAELQKRELSLSPEADRRTLIRRLWFDLLGLPPAPEQVEQFVHDPDPRAYERLVETCLASPHFGERFARHWLDVVRFAESDGFETNQPRPNAWPYRDYVISAFNSDKPYDQFVKEQLAGDQLGADAATGFLVGGPWDRVKSPDPVLTAQQRADELHDMVSTTGSAFLGLTIGCARCHSHKFDPIPQTDYYAIKACLAGVEHGERPLSSQLSSDRTAQLTALRKRLQSIDAERNALQSLASRRRFVFVDDASPLTKPLTPTQPSASHPAGRGRGEADDAGELQRLPNLGRAYFWWDQTPKSDLMLWSPRLTGRYRIWISWGCGWHTHTQAAQYLLDQDGDPATKNDQQPLAVIDQRLFADGSGEPFASKPLWSGLLSVGEHLLQPQSAVLLRSDESGRPTTADLVLFEELLPEQKDAASSDSGRGPAPGESTAIVRNFPPTDPKQPVKSPSPEATSATETRVSASGTRPPQPALRAPVTARENSDRFSPAAAKYVRFTILATNQGEPCLDELEVFSAGPESRNVAAKREGLKVTSSGDLQGYPIHQLAHLNDGRYGNSFSWISNQPGQGWVQIEFPQVEQIERVVWSRDREPQPKFSDRTATQYRIEISLDGQQWQMVAHSDDRVPYGLLPEAMPYRPVFGFSSDQIARREQLDLQRADLEKQISQLSAVPMVYAGRMVTSPATFRLHRGDPTQPREEVAPGVLSQMSPTATLSPQLTDAERRLALANWIASPANPLTARVIVNRIWQTHFGTGLVATASDFGVNGARPSHPELLDWLASELVRPGQASPPNTVPWSLKSIHRLIVLSATYRQAAHPHAAGLRADAQSRLLWRFPPRRLEAEMLRDAILSASGQLDARLGGPGFDLFEPNTNYVKVYNSRTEFGPETFRRMIYQHKPRMQLDATFGAFDCPDAGQITPRRNSSTTPLQALNLLNSPFLLQQSELLARRIKQDAGTDLDQQIARGFAITLGRAPDEAERAAARDLVQEHGLTIFCRALFNANEFVIVY